MRHIIDAMLILNVNFNMYPRVTFYVSTNHFD